MSWISLLLRGHRALLVASTVGLGVAGSKVADDITSCAWWLMVAGFAGLLALSDVCRQTDSPVRELSRSVGVAYGQAASDYVRVANRRWLGAGAILATLLLASSIVVGMALGFDTATQVKTWNLLTGM
jgi:hypothetical protein